MIKTIIFDLAEVYLTGLKDAEYMLGPVLNIPAVEIEKHLHDETLGELFNGKITEDEYWKKIIEKNNWNVDIESVKQSVRHNFREIDGTRDIIQELKQRGFKMGLLSVHAKEWIDYCEKKFGYHGLFNTIMYSFDVAISKPYLKAYKLLLDKMKSQAEESLFIDDSLENINSARQLGINVIQFKNARQLREDLQKINLL